MVVKKTIVPVNSRGVELPACEGEYIFFQVKFNHFRDVSESTEHVVRDREEWCTAEAVLRLPDTYRVDGKKTQLIICCHGAGSRVCEADNRIGGVAYAAKCVEAGYAVLDVCGSEPHGLTMGCPEHLWALYKAYRYAVSHYHLTERVLVAGASMGGQTAVNFANMYPSIVLALGLIYPRLNIDGVTVGDHTCIGTWDKRTKDASGLSTYDRILKNYRFPDENWNEDRVRGFNPYRTRSFLNHEGERVVIPPCPIKIWQGLADTTVDPVMVQEFAQSVRRSGSYIELHLLEGVGHCISPVMEEEMVYWFNRFV